MSGKKGETPRVRPIEGFCKETSKAGGIAPTLWIYETSAALNPSGYPTQAQLLSRLWHSLRLMNSLSGGNEGTACPVPLEKSQSPSSVVCSGSS